MKGMRVELRMQAHRGRQETTHDRPMAHAVCQCLTSIPSTTTQRHRIPGNPQADTTSYRYAVSLFPSFIFTGSDAVRTVRYRYRPTSSTSYFQAGRDSLVVGRPPAQPSAQGRPAEYAKTADHDSRTHTKVYHYRTERRQSIFGSHGVLHNWQGFTLSK